MADKIPNYTQEQTDELVTAYTDADSPNQRDMVVSEFADKFGKANKALSQNWFRKTSTLKRRTKRNAVKSPSAKRQSSRILLARWALMQKRLNRSKKPTRPRCS